MIESQEEKLQTEPVTEEASDALKSKVRYIAGACIHKIVGRLRANVIKSIGKGSENDRFQRQWYHRCFRLLNGLRISEKELKEITAHPLVRTPNCWFFHAHAQILKIFGKNFQFLKLKNYMFIAWASFHN